MSTATVIFAVVFYAATLLGAAGLVARIAGYARTPAPLKIPTTPAPATRAGVVLRMLREVALFESLFKSNLWTWALGWLFHVCLALVLLRHVRYFLEPVPALIVAIQPFGIYAAFGMLIGIAGLWIRRWLVDRVRYISTPSDHLMLALLAIIAASGLMLKFVAHTDIVAVKAFVLGLLFFEWQPLPASAPLYVHLALVALLIAIFPYSKLLHAPGIFFSPTRNQVDDARGHRHLARWAADLER